MDEKELERYARHILLPEIGGAGQARLLGAKVLVIGAGESLSGSLLIFDGLRTEFRKIKMHPDPACALCGADATIKALG